MLYFVVYHGVFHFLFTLSYLTQFGLFSLDVKFQCYFEENKVSRNKISIRRVKTLFCLTSIVFTCFCCMRFLAVFSTITLRGL